MARKFKKLKERKNLEIKAYSSKVGCDKERKEYPAHFGNYEKLKLELEGGLQEYPITSGWKIWTKGDPGEVRIVFDIKYNECGVVYHDPEGTRHEGSKSKPFAMTELVDESIDDRASYESHTANKSKNAKPTTSKTSSSGGKTTGTLLSGTGEGERWKTPKGKKRTGW